MFRKPAITIGLLSLTFAAALAQTVIKPPKNNYTPQQDVELGQKAAAEVREQYPIVDNADIASYLTTLGDRLVATAPSELSQPVFEYSFTPVNVKDINAFALPGGPMFVNRGMFDAAASEGEVAGVMAHELSHVLLRHGTANASKAQNPWLQLGQLVGILSGAVVGGSAGSVIIQGSQFGLGTLMLRYSRDFEKQADLLGAQIMARAGYDPRALARMFETIEKESKGEASPQWMSSHPNPGNRTAYITKEAEQLTIAAPADSSRFPTIKKVFESLPPAKSAADLERRSRGDDAPKSVGTPGQPVPAPAAQHRRVGAEGIFEASVPINWTRLESSQSVRFVPQNAYGSLNGETVFTHGIDFGVAWPASRDLLNATNAWLNAVGQGNPDLRRAGDQRTVQLSQRTAIMTPFDNPSPLGGRERIAAYTTFLADGTLFYYLTVAPEAAVGVYEPVFQMVARSIRLTDGR